MSNIEVRELNKNEHSLWDEMIENSQCGTIFHCSDWLTICSDSLNKKLKIFGYFKDEQLAGGCSLFIYKEKKLFKIASSIIQMIPYGGLALAKSLSSEVRKQEREYRDIIMSLCNIFDKEHFDKIELVNSPDFVDIRPFTWDKWESRIRYTYYLNLKSDIERSVSKKVRNTVGKASRNNITVKKLNDASIFYDLFSMTFKRQNRHIPVKKEFFERIIDSLISKNAGEMWIAETPSGNTASAEIIVWDNKMVYRWSAASNTDFLYTGSTSLLLYKIFQDLKKREFECINLMAANTPSLAKFISGFNPALIPYYVAEKSSIKYNMLKSVEKTLRGI